MIRSVFVLMVLLVMIGCNDDKKQSQPEPEIVEVETTTPEPPKQEAMKGSIDVELESENLQQIFNEYIELKTAFVYSNAAEAAASASKLTKLYEGQTIPPAIQSSTNRILNATNINEQRTAFFALSKAMETLLEGAITSGTIYKQYCPMAFDNQGAFWLSESKEIRNPYFGSKMLKCGRIDAELQ